MSPGSYSEWYTERLLEDGFCLATQTNFPQVRNHLFWNPSFQTFKSFFEIDPESLILQPNFTLFSIQQGHGEVFHPAALIMISTQYPILAEIPTVDVQMIDRLR